MKTKKLMTAALVAGTLVCGIVRNANAGLIFVTGSSGDAGDAFEFFTHPVFDAIAVGFFIYWPAGALLALLDNPSEAASQLSDRIAAYGADSVESKNLATLIVNAEILEQKTNKQTRITREELKLAAPKFVQTAGFGKMMMDLAQANAEAQRQ